MYYNIHTHSSNSSDGVLQIVNQYPHEFDNTSKYFSIGIHPWYIVENRMQKDLDGIEQKVQFENCLAIGECGLDKRIEFPLDVQLQVFEQQLLIAKKYNKPVIIHCVAAYQELIEITKKIDPNVPLVIHGFSKNIQVANQLLESGFYLSFGKYLLRNPDLAPVFKQISNDKFFLETDTIEESIEDVYKKAASIKNIKIEELKNIITNNFKTVFGNGRMERKS